MSVMEVLLACVKTARQLGGNYRRVTQKDDFFVFVRNFVRIVPFGPGNLTVEESSGALPAAPKGTLPCPRKAMDFKEPA
jgi:hypothetical protein